MRVLFYLTGTKYYGIYNELLSTRAYKYIYIYSYENRLKVSVVQARVSLNQSVSKIDFKKKINNFLRSILVDK